MTVVSPKSSLPVPLRVAADAAPSSSTKSPAGAASTSPASAITAPEAATAKTSAIVAEALAAPSTHRLPSPPSTSTAARPSGRAAVDVRDPVAAHRAQLKADLKTALDTLQTMPPALTFFGGARIKDDDPYYAISKDIGRLLAERGVPPRTGAGPGIMQSVPEGYVQRRDTLRERGVAPAPSAQLRAIDGVAPHADLDDTRTQGFNIKLPHEQKLNAVIEVAKEIQLFPFRKLALYENARGVVTFPGGFGTLDELFEIWTLSATGRLSDPLAAVGVEFWAPTLAALKKVAVDERKLIDPAVFERLFVTDDPHALLDHMLGSSPSPSPSSPSSSSPSSSPSSPSSSSSSSLPKGFEQGPVELRKTLVKEVDVAARGMRELAPAVAFLGGESLATDDKALAIARGVASVVAGHGVAVRVGDGGTGSQAVVDAAAAAGAQHGQLQSIAWEHDAMPDLHGPSPAATFSERIPHKELLLRSAEAYVVLPSGLKGLDEMATVLCQMQTGKLPKRPLVLVGSDYWKPVLDAFAKTMLTPERKLIAPEDMELFTVVDTVEDAQRALTNLRPSSAAAQPR